MIEQEFQKLLDKAWTEDEIAMIHRIMQGLLFYKRLLPKALQADIVAALQLCNTLKTRLDELSVSTNDTCDRDQSRKRND